MSLAVFFGGASLRGDSIAVGPALAVRYHDGPTGVAHVAGSIGGADDEEVDASVGIAPPLRPQLDRPADDLRIVERVAIARLELVRLVAENLNRYGGLVSARVGSAGMEPDVDHHVVRGPEQRLVHRGLYDGCRRIVHRHRVDATCQVA